MEYTRARRVKGLIRLDKGKNLGSRRHFICPCGLGMGKVGHVLLSPFLGSQVLSPSIGSPLRVHFLKVYLIYGFEILRKDSSYC